MPRDARGLVAAAYAQIKREFLLAPPLMLHSPTPEILAGFWSAFRESLIAGPANRTHREAIAQGVAQINRCPYCADVHSMMRDGATMLHGMGGAESDDGRAGAAHHDTQAMLEWGLATRTPGTEILLQPPFPCRDAPQMIGTALAFHYLNRMVNVFLGESPLPAPSHKL